MRRGWGTIRKAQKVITQFLPPRLLAATTLVGDFPRDSNGDLHTDLTDHQRLPLAEISSVDLSRIFAESFRHGFSCQPVRKFIDQRRRAQITMAIKAIDVPDAIP